MIRNFWIFRGTILLKLASLSVPREFRFSWGQAWEYVRDLAEDECLYSMSPGMAILEDLNA